MSDLNGLPGEDLALYLENALRAIEREIQNNRTAVDPQILLDNVFNMAHNAIIMKKKIDGLRK